MADDNYDKEKARQYASEQRKCYAGLKDTHRKIEKGIKNTQAAIKSSQQPTWYFQGRNKLFKNAQTQFNDYSGPLKLDS